MAEKDAQERTERATPKKLEDARRKGQVPRSVDLGAAAVTLAAAAALQLFGSAAAGGLAGMMARGLELGGADLAYEDAMLRQLGESSALGLLAVLPLFGAMLVAALAAPALIGGWSFSGEALGFKGERLDPVAGIGRMFSLRSLVELVKALAKFALVAGIGVAVVASQMDEVRQLASQPLAAAVVDSGRISAYALLAMTAGLVVIAAVDAPYQLWQHARDLRMSREELREEHKEMEGSPESRARIRSLQQEQARRRMMQDVPKASVVVTNPTHYAVALRYEDGRDGAPVVLAKGADLVAARIRELAAAHGVPLVSAPPLARVLYRHVDIGRQVPHGLFVAVAQVLTYVWQVKLARRRGAPPPPPPEIDPSIERGVRAREG